VVGASTVARRVTISSPARGALQVSEVRAEAGTTASAATATREAALVRRTIRHVSGSFGLGGRAMCRGPAYSGFRVLSEYPRLPGGYPMWFLSPVIDLSPDSCGVLRCSRRAGQRFSRGGVHMFRNRASRFGTVRNAFAENKMMLRRGDAQRQDFTRRRVTRLGN
jgi:hypothetical protein